MSSPSLLLLFCLVGATVAAPAPNRFDRTVSDFFKNASQAIGREAEDAKNVVVIPVVGVVSAVCPGVKDILGLSYEDIGKDEQPDLSSLSLMYINSDVQVKLNMTTAARTFLNSRAYDPDQKVFLYCHGFTDAPTKQGSFSNVSNALYSQGYKNVLALDAGQLLRWLYLRSSTYVAYIGEKLGHVLADLFNLGIDPSRIHIIGHSLGAHISGFTGKQFYNLTGRKVGRISALDPAGPCFAKVEEGMRINKTDAVFVDVIHSDAGVAGLFEPVGDVDFYPNEGLSQPGCTLNDGCSHSRSWQLYTQSIMEPKSFPAAKCKDWDAFKKGKCSDVAYMGFGATSDLTGKYYLQTTGNPPYTLGDEGTKYHNNQGVIRNITDAVGKVLLG